MLHDSTIANGRELPATTASRGKKINFIKMNRTKIEKIHPQILSSFHKRCQNFCNALPSLAMFVLGAALNLVALGLSLMSASLMILVENVGGILQIGVALLLLGVGAALLAVFGIFAYYGLLAMALGLGAIAVALMLIKTSDLIALGNIFMGLGMAMKGGGLAAAAYHVGNLIDVLDDVSGCILCTFHEMKRKHG